MLFDFHVLARIVARPVFVLAILVAPLPAIAEPWSVFERLPVKLPELPEVSAPDWSANPLDRFVYARLEEAGLQPAPAVSRRVWIRRVSYDLVGLPPTPEQVQTFVADPQPDEMAYAAVVERLLASPRYGERWARHWLDVVRYADTDGFAIDGQRQTLWRYRDYVVRTFNADMPYDHMIRQQLAGDELDGGPEAVVATGFYRLGPYEADNMTRENRRQDFLNEMTSAVSSAFLGLTVGCARCHDHKYDPIPQADFYRLQACFVPLERKDVPAPLLSAERLPHIEARKETTEYELHRRQQELAEFRQELKAKLAQVTGEAGCAEVSDEQLDKALQEKDGDTLVEADRKRHAELKTAVDDYAEARPYAEVAVTVRNPEGDQNLSPTHILLNGNVFTPGDAVTPGVLSAVVPWDAGLVEQMASTDASASGRRTLLAHWIASPQNPLTARVMVNRVWQYHLGQGIVATPNDFGFNGAGATHAQLLDYLATWFIRHEWRLKPLHRLIVLSRTYRTASRHPDPELARQMDPDNQLLWRAHHRRLDSESLRDSLLAISGRLNLTTGGPGFFEALPSEMETKYSFFTWNVSEDAERCRRSIYMFQRRNLVHPWMEVFDVADMNQSCERRQTSVTAPQVLATLNSQFAYEVASSLAQRLQREVGSQLDAQVRRLYWLALARGPQSRELAACLDWLELKRKAYQQSPPNLTTPNSDAPNSTTANSTTPADTTATAGGSDLLALTDLCLVMMNMNEFMYLD